MTFTIRKEQMGKLAEITRLRYLEKVVGQVRKNFPSQTEKLTDADIRSCAEEGLARSAKYQVTPGRDSTLFIFLMVGLARNFDTQPANDWIKRLLENEGLESHEKLDVIYHRLKAAKGSTASTN